MTTLTPSRAAALWLAAIALAATIAWAEWTLVQQIQAEIARGILDPLANTPRSSP